MYTGWLDGIIDCGAKLLIGMDFGVLWSGRLYCTYQVLDATVKEWRGSGCSSMSRAIYFFCPLVDPSSSCFPLILAAEYARC